jgi:hypothetical protein
MQINQVLTFILSSLLLFACANNSSVNEPNKEDSAKGTASKDTSKKSIPSETKKWIGNTNIQINYHSPAVRGRVIWGGLVPYDAVWVTGAHKATTLEVGKDFEVGGKTLPAGKYAIFTIPGKDTWTVILNKNWNQHLADDYSEAEDLVRLQVKPQLVDSTQERLKYEIDQRGEKLANIIISWEKVRVPFEIRIL